MSARYQIRLKDITGALVAVLVDWFRLDYSLKVNGMDSHTLAIDGNLEIVNSFVTDAQIEVWRRDIAQGIDWYKDYEGFHRTGVDQITDAPLAMFTSYGRGYDDLINRRIIAYPAGSSQAAKSGPGETVIKEFVAENAGPGATSPPRLLASGVTSGLTVQADGGAGASWTGERAYNNLLQVVQDVAVATSVDFKVVGTGPGTFEFRAKAKPWGADRSTAGLVPTTGLNGAGNPPIVFSLGFGNMGLPVFSNNRTEEVNAVYALGQGIETARNIRLREDLAAIAASPWNRHEISRNANTEDNNAGLDAVGDAALVEFAARQSFTFQVLQTPAYQYGREYFVGDLVTARYKAVERRYQITGVEITVEQGRETIALEVTNVA